MQPRDQPFLFLLPPPPLPPGLPRPSCIRPGCWEALETRFFKNITEVQVSLAEQPLESCPQRWWWCPGTWDSFATCTPPGLVGVGKEGHPTQPVSHPFFLQTSGTVVLSPSWSTSMEALTWKGQAT